MKVSSSFMDEVKEMITGFEKNGTPPTSMAWMHFVMIIFIHVFWAFDKWHDGEN